MGPCIASKSKRPKSPTFSSRAMAFSYLLQLNGWKHRLESFCKHSPFTGVFPFAGCASGMRGTLREPPALGRRRPSAEPEAVPHGVRDRCWKSHGRCHRMVPAPLCRRRSHGTQWAWMRPKGIWPTNLSSDGGEMSVFPPSRRFPVLPPDGHVLRCCRR